MNDDWSTDIKRLFLELLTPLLRYIDLVALTHVSKFFFDHIYLPRIASEIIRDTFEKNNICFDNLIYRMGSSSVLFGGMIMGVVMDDISITSDLDLLFYKFEDKMFKPVEKISVRRGAENDDVIEYAFNLKRNYKAIVGEIAYPFGLVKEDRTSSDKRMYQFVSILREAPSICDYIAKNCDLECTKIFWDGHKIYIRDYLSLIHKRVVFNINKYFHLNFRFLTYLGRAWQDDMWYYIVNEKMQDRYDKYSKKFILVDSNDNTVEKAQIDIMVVMKDIVNRNHIDVPRYFKSKDTTDSYSGTRSRLGALYYHLTWNIKYTKPEIHHEWYHYDRIPSDYFYRYGIDLPEIYRHNNKFLRRVRSEMVSSKIFMKETD